MTLLHIKYSGMETKIKYQTELITELEDKIKSYCDEIKKVRKITKRCN